MLHLSDILVYPVKSLAGLQLSQAWVSEMGLLWDRCMMLTEPEGTFVTARQYPELVRFTPLIHPHGLLITAPNHETIEVPFAVFSDADAPTEVWGTHFPAQIASQEINDWFSRQLNRPLQLRWIGEFSQRRVKRHPNTALSFADGYPYLLINQASFDDLQRRSPAELDIRQLRGNLIVQGADAFAEDHWSVIQIGEIVFDVVKPCSRCIFTTVNIQTGQKHPGNEPLHTLKQYRTAAEGDVDFGMNLIARNHGALKKGDLLKVLESKAPRLYRASRLVEQEQPVPQDEYQTLTIAYEGNTFHGNNQQILLEQLEQQGIRIPYSCRAGLCGSCQLILENGQVHPLKQSAIRDEQQILSCSCIPKTDIALARPDYPVTRRKKS